MIKSFSSSLKLFKLSFKEMTKISETSEAKVFYDKEPGEKYPNEVSIYNDHVEVTFNMAFSLGGVIDYTYMVSKLIKEFW